MVALAQAGLSPLWCVVWATAGNTLGGVTCYYIGRLGKTEWIERYLRISHERIEKTKAFLRGRGAVMALFVALPYVGDAIAVVLGLMRSNALITTLSMMIGKALRYIAVIYAAEGIASLF
jgi:membrane protein YqaA with SNARE-associated domain